MEVKNIFRELENAPIDTGAGIKVIKMTGDDSISVFAAQIAAQTALNPHYHQFGIETYQILKGEGIMNVGDVQNDSVVWTHKFEVKTGDCFTIPEGKVHQIVNPTNEILWAIFTGKECHLSTDRYFVKQ